MLGDQSGKSITKLLSDNYSGMFVRVWYGPLFAKVQ